MAPSSSTPPRPETPQARPSSHFYGTSTAGNGTFTLVGGTTGPGAQMNFYDSSTAGNGTFTINGAGGYYPIESVLQLLRQLDPRQWHLHRQRRRRQHGRQRISAAIFISLHNCRAAGNATLIANGGVNGGAGGSIRLSAGSPTGSTARVEVFGNGSGDFTNGTLDISTEVFRQAPTFGSIEGNGVVFLGALT